MHQLPQRLRGKRFISRYLDCSQFVLASGIDGESHVHGSFLRTAFNNLGLRIAECRLQISSLKVDRKKILVLLRAKDRTREISTEQLFGGRFKQGQFVLACSSECDIANVNLRTGDRENERFDRAIFGPGAQIVGLALHVVCDQQALQRVRNLIHQFATHGELSLKQRHRGMELLKQFLIREPDQIVEANWNERFGIVDLQLKLGALGGVLKAVKDIAERAGVVKHPGSLFEVVFAHGLPDLQATRSNNFF